MTLFAWVDCDRQYFIEIRGSLEEGYNVRRQIWHHLITDVNAYAQMMDLEIPKPVAAYIHYAICSDVDWNNIRRCDDIKLEKRLGTSSWD